MRKLFFSILSTVIFLPLFSQTFTRSELPTVTTIPWEITMGPDDFLWMTDSGGTVSRIDPANGDKTEVYTAPDYFAGSPLEDNVLCPNLYIRFGTLGLALHPDFSNPGTAFIYFVYSYNSGTAGAPSTKFRIKRLEWNATSNEVVADTNIVNLITTGYDHVGGRLKAVKQNGIPYLFLTVGDNGRSEQNAPNCYSPQSTNPNNFTQDVTTQNGKIHRFNMDGSIPTENPIPDNSYYTRGHRHPQGLMYHPDLEILYGIEHGDRTDDEINILHKGMNYGWKDVRGFHGDGSFEGEDEFVANYTPHPLVENDSLVEPLYAWCTTPDTSSFWLDWCTVAPSGGAYYGSNAIPQWTNSLLVVTLKDGLTTDCEVYQFKLDSSGELVPPAADSPNPKKFFAEDQELNGRLRDIAISNDGQTIYLINNERANSTISEKITVYQADSTTSVNEIATTAFNIQLVPNPVADVLTLRGLENYSDAKYIQFTTITGQSVSATLNGKNTVNVSKLKNGIYMLHLIFEEGVYTSKFVKVDR